MQKLQQIFASKLRLVVNNANVGANYLSTSSNAKASARQGQPTTTGGTRMPPGYQSNPFALYVKDNFKLNEGERATDVVKRVSVDWNKLSKSEKNVYVENAKKATERKKADFQKLPEGEKDELLSKSIERRAKRKHMSKMRDLHKFRAETNKPKQPLTSYMLFVKELRSKGELPKLVGIGKEEVAKFGTAAGEKWRQLASKDKEVYQEKAKALRDAYREELAVWKKENAVAIEKFSTDHRPKSKQQPKKMKKTTGAAKKAKVRSSKRKVASASGAAHAKPKKRTAMAPKKGKGKSTTAAEKS